MYLKVHAVWHFHPNCWCYTVCHIYIYILRTYIVRFQLVTVNCHFYQFCWAIAQLFFFFFILCWITILLQLSRIFYVCVVCQYFILYTTNCCMECLIVVIVLVVKQVLTVIFILFIGMVIEEIFNIFSECCVSHKLILNICISYTSLSQFGFFFPVGNSGGFLQGCYSA